MARPQPVAVMDIFCHHPYPIPGDRSQFFNITVLVFQVGNLLDRLKARDEVHPLGAHAGRVGQVLEQHHIPRPDDHKARPANHIQEIFLTYLHLFLALVNGQEWIEQPEQ